MRKTIIETLIELAAKDPRVILLTADLGYTVLEPFIEKFPERYMNVGVAEQNAVGIATGLAKAGFFPFVYSIVTFASLRPYEFIRNGPVRHDLPVRIIAVGEGFDYGPAGHTHYGIEDIGLMRLQNGLTVVVPSDCQQAQAALLKTWDLSGPVYYRVSKNHIDDQIGLNGEFELGQVKEIIRGNDLVFVSVGSITQEVLKASQNLNKQGISASVVVVSNFHPDCEKALIPILKRFPAVVTVEAHSSIGGLGSFIAEIIAGHSIPSRLFRCGISKRIDGFLGSKEFMNHKYGLSADCLERTAGEVFKMIRHSNAFINKDKTGNNSLRPTPCLFCQEAKDRILYPAHLNPKSFSAYSFSARRRRQREHYQIVMCEKCSLVRSSPVIDEKSQDLLYQDSQFFFHNEVSYVARTYANVLEKFIEKYQVSIKSLLEVGCSNGFFLEKAMQMGIDDVVGVEPSQDCLKYAKESIRPRIINDSYKPELFKNKQFDLICSFQVLDHMQDPKKLLEFWATHLKPGGYVIIACHDVQSWSVKLFGRHHPIFDVEHIYLFSKKTLKMLLESVGLTVCEVRSLTNTYPLGYWVRMVSGAGCWKEKIPKMILDIPITLKPGNLCLVAKKGGAYAHG
jgi:transketolase